MVKFESMPRHTHSHARAMRVGGCFYGAVPRSEITYLFPCARYRSSACHTQNRHFCMDTEGARLAPARHENRRTERSAYRLVVGVTAAVVVFHCQYPSLVVVSYVGDSGATFAVAVPRSRCGRRVRFGLGFDRCSSARGQGVGCWRWTAFGRCSWCADRRCCTLPLLRNGAAACAEQDRQSQCAAQQRRIRGAMLCPPQIRSVAASQRVLPRRL